MKHIRTLALSVILVAPLAAQEPETRAASNPAPQETISLEFRGGSLSDLIAEIRRVADGANIVASALASEVELPAITLRDATVYQALQAVRNIVSQPYAVRVEPHLDADTSKPVFSVGVMKVQNPQVSTTSGPDRRVHVFSIRSLIEELPSDPPGFADKLFSTETVLSAVENGLEVSRPASHGKERVEGQAPWDMRYHEDSKLLFVSAQGAQLSLVHEVLQALEQDVRQARISATQAGHVQNQTGAKDR